ncbi:MAG: NAD(P)-binding protein [Flavobacteriales bacterium]|nr:NAD(P)-binding protein [Flavobacteriales bacterium]
MLGACGTEKGGEHKEVDYDVIVVGAGAAGMYAACHLDKQGVDVKILEATSTHGGRVQCNRTFSDGFIEYGPEEVYSSPDFPTPLRISYLVWMKRDASEEGIDSNTCKVVGDSVLFGNEFWDLLPDSGQYTVDIYRDLWNWDSTQIHAFSLGYSYADVSFIKDGKITVKADDDSYVQSQEWMRGAYAKHRVRHQLHCNFTNEWARFWQLPVVHA